MARLTPEELEQLRRRLSLVRQEYRQLRMDLARRRARRLWHALTVSQRFRQD